MCGRSAKTRVAWSKRGFRDHRPNSSAVDLEQVLRSKNEAYSVIIFGFTFKLNFYNNQKGMSSSKSSYAAGGGFSGVCWLGGGVFGLLVGVGAAVFCCGAL